MDKEYTKPEQEALMAEEALRTGLIAFRDQGTSVGMSVPSLLDAVNANMLPIRKLYADYECAAMEMETKFKVLDTRFSVEYDRNPIESIKTRIKSPESILRKMDARGYSMNMESLTENVRDIAGVRVICSFVDDLYRLAEYLLSQDDIILVEKKDYIANPKPNGYRSLHLIVKVPIFTEKGKKWMYVEVQLRTIAMDFWASLEHKLRYKKEIPSEEMEELSKELYDCAVISASLDARMQRVKDRLSERQETGK